MSEIGFIGDRDSVWGFRAFGVAVRPAATAEEASLALRELVRAGCSIIFVTEDVYEACSEEIVRYRELPVPVITVLPGVRGSRGVAAGEIHRAVSAAVGADILGMTGKG